MSRQQRHARHRPRRLQKSGRVLVRPDSSEQHGVFGGFFQAVAMRGDHRAEFTERLVVPWLSEAVRPLPQLVADIENGHPVTLSDVSANVDGLSNVLATAAGSGVSTRLLELTRAQAAAGHARAGFTRTVAALTTPGQRSPSVGRRASREQPAP